MVWRSQALCGGEAKCYHLKNSQERRYLHGIPFSLEEGNLGENENTERIETPYFLRKTEKGSKVEDRELKLRDFILPKEILAKV